MTEPSRFAKSGITYGALLRDLRDRFRDGGVPDWATSAEWLAMDALGCTRTELLSRVERIAGPEQVRLLDQWASRRLQREPVQYILGYTEFCGLRLQVDSRVLIPRPETELLVEHAVRVASAGNGPVRLLDIGTGSGCIALALAKLLPDAEVWGAESSDEALAVARANAEALELNVRWLKMDILDTQPPGGPFTIIVSNPPYIPKSEIDSVMPEVSSYEPHAALFVEGDPLIFYRSILNSCADILAPGGCVFFEVNPDFALEIEQLMRGRSVFVDTGIEPDLANRRRIVWGRRDG